MEHYMDGGYLMRWDDWLLDRWYNHRQKWHVSFLFMLARVDICHVFLICFLHFILFSFPFLRFWSASLLQLISLFWSLLLLRLKSTSSTSIAFLARGSLHAVAVPTDHTWSYHVKLSVIVLLRSLPSPIATTQSFETCLGCCRGPSCNCRTILK